MIRPVASRHGLALALVLATIATVRVAEADPNTPAAAPAGVAAPPPNSVNGESLTEKTSANGPAERFGHKGQLTIASDAALVTENTVVSGVSGSTTVIQLQPTVDYFVARSISVGGFVETNYTSDNSGHAYTLGVGARVGYNFTLADLVSFWPRIGLSIDDTSTTVNASSTAVTSGGGPTTTTTSTTTQNTSLALNVFTPLMFHPVAHFFCGFGPFVDADLTGSARSTTWGGKITLGGWFF
jgi:hypothetical protein